MTAALDTPTDPTPLALAPEATAKPRVIKAGGAKGQAIIDALTKNISATRRELAEAAGCTVGRVGEVIRYLAAHGTPDEQALIAQHQASKPIAERSRAIEQSTVVGDADKKAKKAAADKARRQRKREAEAQ